MPFGFCNAPATFQRCMTAIFHELIEDSMEVFIDDFSVFGSSFDHWLKNLEKTLKSLIQDHRLHGSFYPAISIHKTRCKSTPNLMDLATLRISYRDQCRPFGGHHGIATTAKKVLTPEFHIEISGKKGAENLAADHLSRLEHPDLGTLTMAEIRDLFPKE
nr:retrovirus-related Pol polyprotein from transposon 17.6 [Tanacetum cinerariifolium]